MKGIGVSQTRKYKDESWVEYLHRLRYIQATTSCSNEEIIKKLRCDISPRTIECIFYSTNDFEDMIARVEELSRKKIDFSHKNSYKDFKASTNRFDNDILDLNTETKINKKVLKCFKCGKSGHIARTCYSKNHRNMLINKKINDTKLDMRKILINDIEISALFDSGSSINILTRKIANRMRNVNITKLSKPVEINLLNGSCIKTSYILNCEVIYDNNKIEETFNVIETGIIDVIVGKDLMDKFNNTKVFPIECRIDTKDNQIVSWSRPFKNFKDKEDLKKVISEYESRGIIAKSKSVWLNPIVLTRKKSGALRFTLDLRKVNNLVNLDQFTLPNIQEIIRSLKDMSYFSVIDLKDGYFQVNLSKKDREKTTFLDTNNRLMQFRKMPQGYKNSPAIFQRGMGMILEGMIGKICLSYIDDILVFGKDVSEHDDNLKIIKDRLKKYNLVINEEKSVYKTDEVEFLIIGYPKIKYHH
ncbi:Retrovirus-related Pol polyprotein from transposon opus [Dictyocoela muelleri]|nr:Retrovirus-related Pol polyprotein from transposon opus [Dictyocoela muelleri]